MFANRPTACNGSWPANRGGALWANAGTACNSSTRANSYTNGRNIFPLRFPDSDTLRPPFLRRPGGWANASGPCNATLAANGYTGAAGRPANASSPANSVLAVNA